MKPFINPGIENLMRRRKVFHSKKITFFLLELVVFGIILTLVNSSVLFAAEAILSWDPNTERDLAGYKVYHGTSPGTYGDPIDVGNQTSYAEIGLSPGTHYFAVTAYDTSGNESGFSVEVSKVISKSITLSSREVGGCGMILPKDGNPSGPGQAADLMLLVGAVFLLFMKKLIFFESSQSTESEKGHANN